MGKRGSQRKNAALLDGEEDEDDSFGSAASVKSGYLWASRADMVELNRDDMLDHVVDALYEKRGSTREKALAAIIEGFNSHVQIEFVEKQFATLLHQCLSSIKRVSVREIALASHVIGLLALTVGCGPNGNEIFEESLPPISQALKSGIEVSKTTALLECLAIVSFVGGNDAEEKEKSMQLMWQLIRPKLGPNVIAVKPSPALIASVVTAWAFVLTSIDGNSCDPKHWQETVSYLSTLLDKDNRSVRIAAGEALAVIFETGRLDEFSSANHGLCEFSHIQGLKGKLINQMRDLSMEPGGRGTGKKDLSNQRNLFRDILAYLEDGCSPQTSRKIGGETLSTSTWSQLIQLNFLKRFLGGGFVKHVQDNEFIQDVVGFTPKRVQLSDVESSMSRSEKQITELLEIQFPFELFMPADDDFSHLQRLYKSPNSALSKARTQHLNKQRLMSQSRNGGRFAVGVEEDG